MGYVEHLTGFTAKDNDDKTVFIGDFIVNLKPVKKIVSKKTSLPWLVIEGEVIRVVSSKDGNQAGPGSEFSKLYSGADADGIREFANDCKTIGIDLDQSSDDAFEASFAGAENKKAYVRAWQYESKKNPGQKNQSFAIKSKKLITPELEIPELLF